VRGIFWDAPIRHEALDYLYGMESFFGAWSSGSSGHC